MSGKTASAKRRREEKLVGELVREHDYMFMEVKREAERHTTQFRHDRVRSKTSLIPAACIILVVPETSHLGIGIKKMRAERAAANTKRSGTKSRRIRREKT